MKFLAQKLKPLYLFILIGALYYSSLVVHANSYLGVSSKASQYQLDKSKSCFDLKMPAGQKETLQVVLTNSSEKAIHVKIKIASAITNDNGVIDYVSEKKQNDQSLKYNIADLVKYDETVEIPANSSIDYPVELTSPNQDFDGILMGGMHFEEVDQDEQDASTKGKSAFSNSFAYVKLLVLHGKNDDVKGDLKLNYVFADLDNYHNSLKANISNPIARTVSHMDSIVKVYRKDDTQKKKPLYENESHEQQMAPNSNFNYNFRLGDGTKIKPGEYRWVQDIKSTQGEWHFEQNFEILAGTAKKLNAKDVTIEEPKLKYKFSLDKNGYFILCLLILLIVIWIWRKKYRKNENEQK